MQTTFTVQPLPDEPARKVTKIRSYRGGGFGLLAPYHAAKAGFVTKSMVDYRKTGRQTLSETTESFSASDRVKFSYHPDGFVQFSGENQGNIVSGRDPVTGEPKGMGFMTNPLSSPVITGPSFGISFWGLDDFQVQKGTPHGDLVTFEEGDFVYDHCDETSWGTYGIEFFIFGPMFQPYVRKTGPKQFELDLWLNQFLPAGGAFNLKVIRLGQQPYFLGAACFRRPWSTGGGAPASGWIIGSPGARTRGWVKPVLHAHYPGNGIKIEQSLDYDQWTHPTPTDQGDEPQARFARDYRGLFQRAEAEMLLRSVREVPALDAVQEGTAVLAEVMDGVRVEPLATAGPEGPTRTVLSILAVLGLRAARAFHLLVATGYAAEAASFAGRLHSVMRTARQIRDDETGTVALRLAEGMTLEQLDPEAWAAAREVMEVHLGQMPSIAPVAAGAGVQPGVPFAGQRDPLRDDHLGKVALLAISELASIAFNVLRGDEAPEEIRDRVNGFRAHVANMIRREIDTAQTPSISE